MSSVDKAALKLIGLKTVADTSIGCDFTIHYLWKPVLMEESLLLELM